jgi:hypothetical protein
LAVNRHKKAAGGVATCGDFGWKVFIAAASPDCRANKKSKTSR